MPFAPHHTEVYGSKDVLFSLGYALVSFVIKAQVYIWGPLLESETFPDVWNDVMIVGPTFPDVWE